MCDLDFVPIESQGTVVPKIFQRRYFFTFRNENFQVSNYATTNEEGEKNCSVLVYHEKVSEFDCQNCMHLARLPQNPYFNRFVA